MFGYGRAMTQIGYKHRSRNITASGDPAHVVMPLAYRVASLLKRWLMGTHQGVFRLTPVDDYFDEFTFRLNRHCSWPRSLQAGNPRSEDEPQPIEVRRAKWIPPTAIAAGFVPDPPAGSCEG